MTYKEKKSLYESIMKETAKTVKRMINESSITTTKVTPEIAQICSFIRSYYIVGDAFRRRNFNEKYAINATPLQYFSEADLIYRYVAALILFNKDIPNSLDDVESIGIFKNYVDAYLKKSGAEEDEFIEDLKRTYNLAKNAFEKIKEW